MKNISLLAILAIVLLSSCATARPHAQQVCDTYNELRPDVVAAREVIASGFEAYPPKVQGALRRIDARLPQLDQIGRAACGLAESTVPIDWKKAKTVIDEVTPYLVILKQQGVI
jgi:hypothetical protein